MGWDVTRGGEPLAGTYTEGYVDALDAVLDIITSDLAVLNEDDDDRELASFLKSIVRDLVRLWPPLVPVPGAYKL